MAVAVVTRAFFQCFSKFRFVRWESVIVLVPSAEGPIQMREIS